MDAAVRAITLADISDGSELIAELDLSDDELAARGILLSDHGEISGWGPTVSRFVEVPTGDQFCLLRLEFRPEPLDVYGQLTRNAADTLAVLLDALQIPPDRVVFQVPDEEWTNLQEGYDRSRWLQSKARCLHEAEGS